MEQAMNLTRYSNKFTNSDPKVLKSCVSTTTIRFMPFSAMQLETTPEKLYENYEKKPAGLRENQQYI